MPTVNINSFSAGLQPPYRELKAITPNDSVDLPDGACLAINCQVAGNASVIDYRGNTVTIALSVGLNQYIVKRVRLTGTTATGLTACYN